MPTRNLFIILVSLAIAVLTHAARDRTQHGRRLGELLAAVERSYIEPIDGNALFEAAIDGVMSKLDENSRYVRRSERSDFEAALDLEFCGIGLELAEAGFGGLRRPGADDRTIATGHLSIEGLMPGSPAWRAGLAAGDMILAIDGDSTRGMTIPEAVARLRGRPGSSVILTIAGAGADASETAVRDVTLVRETIRIESVLGDRRRDDGSWEWRLEGRPDIALVRITSFGEHTREDLGKAVEEILRGGRTAGLVLDLRGNPGGLVASAVEVSDLFLDSREMIVATRGRPTAAGTAVSRTTDEAPLDRRLASEGDVVDGAPIAVLVDSETASAAEIVAASLQDHGRAKVFGGRTYGKGTVQQILPLTFDDGLLKLTTSEYLRPNGRGIHRGADDDDEDAWGVLPDPGLEIVPNRESRSRLNQWRRTRDMVRRRSSETAVEGHSMAELPEQVDPVLGRAVSWLTGLEPAPRTPEKSSPPRR